MLRPILILSLLLFAGCKASFKHNTGDEVRLSDSQKEQLKGERGIQGIPGPSGNEGPQGEAGKDGEDGKSFKGPQVFLTPNQGSCVQLSDRVWFKNEGNRGDFYKVSDCTHGANNSSVYCDNVTDGEIGANDRESCTIISSRDTLYRYTIVGTGQDMCVVQYIYDDLPEFRELL